MDRPDLSQVDPIIRAYIEYLENKLSGTNVPSIKRTPRISSETYEPAISTAPIPAEPPTTIQVLSVSSIGLAKRTFRHLYTPQHRGGMGIFDLDVNPPDFPALLSTANEGDNLLLFTSRARVFRYSLSKIISAPVRSHGEHFDRLALESDERIAAILPEQAQGYVAMLSETGRVRILRHHVFGEHMKPGTAMYPAHEFGLLASVTWTSGDGDLFIATEHGIGIRFNEKIISPQGDWGIKVGAGDRAVAITPVYSDSLVFMLSADGKGTVREMSGFAANKSAGGSGKLAMKTDKMVGAFEVDPNDSIFAISRVGKIIRFRANEVPITESVVQGVNCMMLRNDDVTAVIKSEL